MKKRIFYLVTRAEAAGAQANILALLKGFQRKYELSLGCGEDGFLVDQSRALGISSTIFPNLVQPFNFRRDYLAYRDIRAHLAYNPVDLLHAHSSKAGFVGRMAAKSASIPAVFTAHGWGFTDRIPLLRRATVLIAERVISRHCERIVAVSNYDREKGIQALNLTENKIVAIHNGIPDSIYRADPERNKRVSILMVARFVKQKDHAALVEACARIDADFTLTFVGGGPMQYETRLLVAKLGLEKKVIFAGERLDVEQYLKRFQIFALCSHWEGLPISILEAMRAGLPVVAWDVGGIKETVIDHKTGYVVEYRDLDTLTRRISTLIANPTLRKTFGDAGRSLYLDSFSSSHMIDQLDRVYQGILS